ncbi:MAG: sigma-54-dependent Fis family transcriptional regulator [Spirochaetaceae bacterium]|nr:MAG: sigma-54-dependent Fis family transcriptional regulator [Spirochaetaceae bacterium]
MSNPGPAILVIDDDPVAVELIQVTLRANGFENIETCTDSSNAMTLIRTKAIALVLLDLFMPEVSGFDILEYTVQNHPGLPVIVLTADDSIDAAVRCMRIGAFDFMVKPMDRNRLVSAVNHALRVRELENRLDLFAAESHDIAGPQRRDLFETIITRSPRMAAIFQYVEAIAPSPKAVLITGESGTGKELLARAIHEASVRPGEFVPVNVAGLDDVMFSDTLFGHVKGAFTGADRVRTGLVEKARQGTLFLDEIGDLELSSQVKLLRLLQEGEFYPLGSDEPSRVSLRVVAATNADLAEKQMAGTFRRDLYYRLISHLVNVPPLRERSEDIPALLEHYVREASESMNRPVPRIPVEVLNVLERYAFPGNVRELQAIVADAVSRTQGSELSIEVIRGYLGNTGAEAPFQGARGCDDRFVWNGPFPTLQELEDYLIREALERCDWNQTAAARLLGVSQSTLSRREKRKRGMQSA